MALGERMTPAEDQALRNSADIAYLTAEIGRLTVAVEGLRTENARLRALVPGQPPTCGCGRKPTCYGRFSADSPDTFGCDNCCVHAQDHGRCKPVEVPNE